MAEQRLPTLIDLDDTDLTLRNPTYDIRNRTVIDPQENEVGEVDGLIIDENERRVRFIRIASGGVLGFGQTKRLVPVEAIVGIEGKSVHIDRTRQQVTDSQPYDPPLVDAPTFYEALYGQYGYTPFWAAGMGRYPTP
ncbi:MULTISPECIES: PRC-barrel domain-containing protein [unclassified Nocardia]|uniref:PRC-barrel domain-containing protein n=1 Tax=unclassified Nocardia TaxID=2637762 RepID=UPI0024A939C2|nr:MULTISPECIES: PRC-barrel domain-containing protein [unclassified Nocardia]